MTSSSAAAGGASGVCCLLDVDDFRLINDAYGPAFGDALMKAIGERLHGLVVPKGHLARWSGDEFNPIAEDAGLIYELGLTILDQACRQAKAWLDAGTPRVVAVNISLLQLQRGSFMMGLGDDPSRHPVEQFTTATTAPATC